MAVSALEGAATLERFSLLGGPLHRMGRRLGLVRGGTNTVPLGLALGGSLWIVLVALALADGVGQRVFSLSLIGGHVRLLVVIPLLFLCESLLDPRLTTFVETIVRSGVVPKSALDALAIQVDRARRSRDSWLPEAACLLAAVLLSSMGARLQRFGATTALDPAQALTEGTVVLRWCWVACLTIFRFLLLRWVWRIGLWSHFLWRVSRLELHLVPTHPDGVGGLGYLEVVHTAFVPLAAAISALESASFAEGLSTGTQAFGAIYPELALILLVDAVLLLGPLLVFTPKLLAARAQGLSDYMELAARYVSEFEGKWLGTTAPRDQLLGTSDLQSLADLSNSVSIVRKMSLAPLSMRLAMFLVAAAVVPLLPLALFEYPAAELAQKFLASLMGL
jgi:hypothetical protein